MTLNITIFDSILLKNVGDSPYSVRFCRYLGPFFPSLALKVAVNSFESCTSARLQTHPSPGTTIALSLCNLQDWLPGVAGTEPRLGSGFLGGQLIKGGLHQPPFSLRLFALPPIIAVMGRCGKFASASVSSKWFSSEGLSVRPSFLFCRPILFVFPAFFFAFVL
jgi:hypothetical protein